MDLNALLINFIVLITYVFSLASLHVYEIMNSNFFTLSHHIPKVIYLNHLPIIYVTCMIQKLVISLSSVITV